MGVICWWVEVVVCFLILVRFVLNGGWEGICISIYGRIFFILVRVEVCVY